MRIRRSTRLEKREDKNDVPSSRQRDSSSNEERTSEEKQKKMKVGEKDKEQRRKKRSTRDKKKKKVVNEAVTKPISELFGVSEKDRGKKHCYRSFLYNENQYDVGNFVLHHPEKEKEKPYVSIIKEITQRKNDNMMVTVQWFYRPEDTKKRGGGKWESREARELFYSFHKDEVPAESVIGKCEVLFAPLNKQIPSQRQYPSFIVQKVYNPIQRRLSNLTDKVYAKNNREEIDLLIQNTKSRLGELPDQNEPPKIKGHLKKK